MSLDETKQLDSDEIDLAQLFRVIWFFKYRLLVFIIFSFLISVWVSLSLKPTFKAETVFENPSETSTQSNSSLLNNNSGMGFMSLLGGSIPGTASDSFFSQIRSESFLKTVIINNAELDSQMMQKFCPLPSKETPRFSLRSLLIALGLSDNRDPSESQKISLLVRCVNNMLEIVHDKYGADTSSAYRLSIESGNPEFSANLANQIVEKYFTRHKNKRDEDFQNVKKYLSKVITEAQLELTDANKLMQSFIIKNTLLMNIEPSIVTTDTDVSLPLPPSPFAAKLKKDFFSLSQLEKNLSQLKQARLKLSNVKDFNQDEIEKAISSTEVQEAISRTLVTLIAKIDNDKLSADTNFKSQEIKKIVSQELQRLRKQIQVLEEKIERREAQTMKLMTIDNKFQELAIDVSKKQIIFEGLKDQLKEKMLAAGLNNIKQPILLTKAVPPFIIASPNKRLIVALGVALSIFTGIAFILMRQSFIRQVHSLSQLRNLSSFLKCYEIKYKHLKLMSKKSDGTVISQLFFSRNEEIGKLGCIVDLSQKKPNTVLASEFSIIVASYFAANSSKTVCLNTSPSKKLFSANSWKNYVSENSGHNAQGSFNKSYIMINDEDGLISSGEITEIKNKYSDYNKIICALGAEAGDITKFKFIEKCDFYIVIGRSFHFDEYTYKRFSNTVWEKEKKCLGFFLID